ncbi:MAG: branched-chain-amino-acid transaminase [Elusimicrobia bacterium RIFCSPLOWO2_12_FULL_59_9]|nr:MAG: branched-chain-amino-acid transaminase [Elusimicrobia bacterium RIFCSPLOWO2_12_FULL_59_9]
MKIYIDGKYYSKEEAKVSVFDHGLLYGDGVFEGIRAYNGRVFKLDEHLERLFESMRGIFIEPRWSLEKLRSLVVETVRLNGLKDAYIRLVVTRGYGDLGLDLRKCKVPSLIIIADHISLYPESTYQTGVTLVASHLRRVSHQSLTPNIKSLNYLNNILAKDGAVRAGAGEAVMLNMEGYVTECTGDNIFFLKGGVWYTPPAWAGLLDGVTRRVAIELIGKELKMPVKEELFTLFHLYQAEEIFLTGTAAEILPAVKIDGRVIGTGKPGPRTQQLVGHFRDLTRKTGVPVYETAGSAK